MHYSKGIFSYVKTGFSALYEEQSWMLIFKGPCNSAFHSYIVELSHVAAEVNLICAPLLLMITLT